ncbi:MAG: phosphopyruvate hydratase [Holosporales bacterium]|jgi:enolase|nr:phosphopyruvate hydratase [Holosporales bacterium]
MSNIRSIRAREILDSRGYPTIETEMILESGDIGIASVPSGASTGSFEACELRDNDKNRYFGKGVLRAVENVNEIIAREFIGKSASEQKNIDQKMIDMDGTENKSNLGANAILSVSLAYAYAMASFQKIPLYRYINQIFGSSDMGTPKPMMNILNGGVHADNRIDVQEFMIVPSKKASFKEYVLICATVYHNLKRILKSEGHNTNVGDEGGVAPNLCSTTEALDYVIKAIEASGYIPGDDVSIAMDVAASELYKDEIYEIEGSQKTSEEMISFYKNLVNEYPIISIEDPLHEEDWDAWTSMTKNLGEKIQIVGDDLYVTNKKRLLRGIENGSSNAILIKPNQIGTLTETLETIRCAKENGYNIVISHRSGETCDTTISDISVGINAQYIKTGAPSRGERIAKYNRLMRIELEF